MAALGLLNSAVAAYYYLRILVVIYAGARLQAALIAPAVGVLLWGIFPAILPATLKQTSDRFFS
jgi:NADH:ubiquinone oxidoreductase subunit 2 (subunit N)